MKSNGKKAYNRKMRRLYGKLQKQGIGWQECLICGVRWNIGQTMQYCVCGNCELKRPGWLALIPARKNEQGRMMKKGQTLMLPGNAIHLLMKRNSGQFIGKEFMLMAPKMVRALRKKYELLLDNLEQGNGTD